MLFVVVAFPAYLYVENVDEDDDDGKMHTHTQEHFWTICIMFSLLLSLSYELWMNKQQIGNRGGTKEVTVRVKLIYVGWCVYKFFSLDNENM